MSKVSQESLQAAINEAAEKYRVPALSAAVLTGGEHVAAATGILNIETKLEATPESVFQIGSVSKTYTATLIMQLVEEGLIELDQTATSLLSGAAIGRGPHSDEVTVRQLLTHMSGQDGDLFEDTGPDDDALAKYLVLCKELDFLCAPGKYYNYCNAGYSILGRIVEIKRGMSFEDALQTYIAMRTGMQRMTGLASKAMLLRVAAGHVMADDKGTPALAPVTVLPRALVPAGLTVYTTASEMLRLAGAHLPKASKVFDTSLLSQDTAMQMREAQTTLPDGTEWGLGWKIIHHGGETFVGHDGGTVGHSAFLWTHPATETIVAINANGGASSLAFRAIADPIFKAVANGAVPEPELPRVLDDAGDLTPYEGQYDNKGVTMHLKAAGDHIEARAVQKYFGMPDTVFPMRPIGNHCFRATLGGDDKVVMAFHEFADDGRPQLFYAGRLHRRSGN